MHLPRIRAAFAAVGLTGVLACNGDVTESSGADTPPEASTHHVPVSGTVLGSAGQPLAGVTVSPRTVIPTSTRGEASVGVTGERATTDAQGNFSLDVGVIPGDRLRGSAAALRIVVLAYATDARYPRLPSGAAHWDSAQVTGQVVPRDRPPPVAAGVRISLPLPCPAR